MYKNCVRQYLRAGGPTIFTVKRWENIVIRENDQKKYI